MSNTFTLTAKVNPENPQDPYSIAIRRPAIDAQPGLEYFRPFAPGGAQLIQSSRLEGWEAVQIELVVPEPPRKFSPGDVARSRVFGIVRIRDERGEWREVVGQGCGSLDDGRVREFLAGDHYLDLVGNVSELM